MKKILTLVTVVFLSFSANAQFKDRDPFITKKFAGESVKDVFVRTSGGSISVSGSAGEARVEVYVQGNNGRTLSKEEIQKRLDEDYELEVRNDKNKLTVTARPRDRFFNWKQSLSISFNVFVPQNASTDLNTSGGSITMRNLSGTHNFSTSGGSLRLEKLSGKIYGKTSGGSIDVSNSRDKIDLSTSGGSIRAENCSGMVTLNTSGGSITLNTLKGTIKARTSGGSIRGGDIKGELSAHTSGGSIDLQDLYSSVDVSTSGGSMNIRINELAEFVQLNNSGGNIDVKLPGNKGVDLKLKANRINVENLNNFSGRKDDHSMEGKLNGGGIPVNISTSGRITLALNQ